MITRDDVRAHAQAKTAAAAPAAPVRSKSRIKPLSAMRRAIAEATARSWQTIPHVPLHGHETVSIVTNVEGLHAGEPELPRKTSRDRHNLPTITLSRPDLVQSAVLRGNACGPCKTPLAGWSGPCASVGPDETKGAGLRRARPWAQGGRDL